MHADKPTHRRGSARTAAEEQHASDCKTVVVTGAYHAPDRARILRDLGRERGHRGRFDLLTVEDPWKLADPAGKGLLDALVTDACLLVRVHRGEQILVAVYGDPVPIVAALKARPELKQGLVIIGEDLRPRSKQGRQVDSEDFAVGCADFRMHDPQKGQDLPDRLRKTLLLKHRPALLTVPGGARVLADDTPKRALVTEQLLTAYGRNAFRRLSLTVHTDCAALGGDAAFTNGHGRPDPHAQTDALTKMLESAATYARDLFPAVQVRTGIVCLKAGQVAKILPVSR